MLPNHVILDTREHVLDYLMGTVDICPQSLFPLLKMGDAFFEVLQDRSDSDYKKALFKYEALGDLLMEESKETQVALEELDKLIDGVGTLMSNYGFYDSREFSQYVFRAWTPDHCAIMDHFSLVPECRSLEP